ncbi:UDP-N-acetylmuramate dehydrogenase [Candidatus Poribacteria bacterium]|nr:UDP-N-acetylmuramate dehydrogenase [Candidatus Poribacteria bacterium]
MQEWISRLKSETDAELKLNEPMSVHTSFRIGGPAEVFAKLSNQLQLNTVIDFCNSNSIPLLFIGRGTNMLFSDQGRRGVVAKLSGQFSGIKFYDERQSLTAGAGVPLPKLARYTAKKSLAGLEFAFGIPGSLGGALIMNAGANSGSVADVIESVEVVDMTENKSEVISISRNKIDFAYRWSSLEKFICITKAFIRMKSDEPEQIFKRMKTYLQKRKSTQPISAASAGCVFRNPPGMSAGKLIDECGLKGEKIGGAQVSELHANFIINANNSTARDVVNLIDKVRTVVERKTGVELELEIGVFHCDN